MLKNYKSISLDIVLLTVCFSWLIEGVLEYSYLSILLLGLAIIVGCVFHFKIRLKRAVLLLFLPGIYVSLLLNGATMGQIRHALMYTFVILFATLYENKLSALKNFPNIIKGMGIFSAFTIIIHALFKTSFERVYFPLLSTKAYETATSYAGAGYYFGVIYRPHIAAGTVAFSLLAYFVALLLKSRKKNTKSIAILFFLSVSLLLTQKKGIIALTVFICLLSYLVLTGKRDTLIRIFKASVIALCLFGILAVYAAVHPESILFTRFYKFYINISQGNSADSGRILLYAKALDLWKESPVFGVGWKAFSTLSLGTYGSGAHQVNLDYLQFLCEEGIFGVCLTMIPIIVMLVKSIKLQHMIKQSNIRECENTHLIIFALCVHFFILIYALFEDPFFDLMYFTIYLISCVVIDEASAELKNSGKCDNLHE